MTNENQKDTKAILGFMFFLSGFCALLYQTIWLRLAFAKFGVITPVVSLVIAIFMLGLGLGSYAAGNYIGRLKGLVGGSAITVYGIIECFIGIGAFLVPIFFSNGANLCTTTGELNSWFYLLSSAVVITISILPFAIAMGATYPVVLEFLRENASTHPQIERNFGLLYAANTAGAWLGAVATVFVLVEILGFTRVLMLGAGCNFLIGLMAIIWGMRTSKLLDQPSLLTTQSKQIEPSINKGLSLIILFTTGFCSMAMEVVWTRSFIVPLGSMVYSFAALLSSYLASNWFGASLYRLNAKQKKIISPFFLIALVALTSTLPLLASNPAFFPSIGPGGVNNLLTVALILSSVMPFSALLGYLTPLLVDELSCDNPAVAGKAYAVNILGCIIGPLLVGYLILPCFGARISLILLILPLVILALTGQKFKGAPLFVKLSAVLISFGILINACFWLGWEEGGLLKALDANLIVHRDYAATTISFTVANQKNLAVNGQAMTTISKITKYMTHLPMVSHKTKPKSVLVICFGMGTSFRSALTWDCKVTVVELVPGVRDAFSYYHANAAEVLRNPNGRIIIDDGRRFLQRTNEKFDIVIVDPPPPVTSAASGLLYSKEFFHLIKKHLNRDGILQEWYGFIDCQSQMRATLRALIQEFPYVTMYKAISDPTISGWHFLASESPIDPITAEEFYARLPEKAKMDLLEWLTSSDRQSEMKQQIAQLIANKIPVTTALSVQEKPIIITDDYPYNEYYMLGRLFGKPVFLSR